MADHDSKLETPFAGSFFSANHVTFKDMSSDISHDIRLNVSNDVSNVVPGIVPMGHRSCLSLVLHLDGQLETFCEYANTVLTRPTTARERAQLIMIHRELSALLKSMECALDAHLCFT